MEINLNLLSNFVSKIDIFDYDEPIFLLKKVKWHICAGHYSDGNFVSKVYLTAFLKIGIPKDEFEKEFQFDTLEEAFEIAIKFVNNTHIPNMFAKLELLKKMVHINTNCLESERTILQNSISNFQTLCQSSFTWE